MPDATPAIIGTKYKQPAEIVPVGRWGIDFSANGNMDTGETLLDAVVIVSENGTGYVKVVEVVAGALVVTVTPETADITDDLTFGDPAIDGGNVSIGFIGGDDGMTYHVEFLTLSSQGAIYEEDMLVSVIDA